MTHLRWDARGRTRSCSRRAIGGVSEGPFASLNLGRKTGDDVERVDENRRRACAEIGADAERLALNYQVHSDARAPRACRVRAASAATASGRTSRSCRSSR